MQRREFLGCSLVAALGLWGCGSDPREQLSAGLSTGGGGFQALKRARTELLFSSSSGRVEANINAQGDVIMSVVPDQSGTILNRLLRSRSGQLTQELLAEASSAQQRFSNPRISVSGDGFSWLQTEAGLTKIVATIGGQRLEPWLPPASSLFSTNLGLDEERGFLYAIAKSGDHAVLLRRHMTSGEVTTVSLPFSGGLQLRMDTSCSYAVGNSAEGAVGIILGSAQVQLLAATAARSYSVNPQGNLGLLTADGQLLYSKPPGSQGFVLKSASYPLIQNSLLSNPDFQPSGGKSPLDQLPPGFSGVVPSGLGMLYQNAVDAQKEQNEWSQAAANQGLMQIYGLNTTAAGGAADVLLVAPFEGQAGLSPEYQLIDRQADQVVTELHAQGEMACLTFNPREGSDALATVILFPVPF